LPGIYLLFNVYIYMDIYYVYAIFIDNIVRYIGKGKGNRKDHHFKNHLRYNKSVNRILNYQIKKAIQNNHLYDARIIFDNLSEQEALKKEIELIKKYGRIIDSSGTLCNICHGGNQPPSVNEIKKLVGHAEWQAIRLQQKQTAQNTIKSKIQDKLIIIEKLLKSQKTIKEIAKDINVNKDTVLRWICKYKIPGSDKQGKRKAIADHLKKQRTKMKGKIQKNAYVYIIVDPLGIKFETANLRIFCKERDIDYSNLRQTVISTKSSKQRKCKGYYIYHQSLQL
jgi:transposase